MMGIARAADQSHTSIGSVPSEQLHRQRTYFLAQVSAFCQDGEVGILRSRRLYGKPRPALVFVGSMRISFKRNEFAFVGPRELPQI